MATPIAVPYADLVELADGFRPGSVIPFAHLYARYVDLMKRKGVPAASPQSLGRAFNRSGWQSKVVRKSRGRRRPSDWSEGAHGPGYQRFSETHCRVIPGALPITEEDQRMADTLRELLGDREDALIPCSKISESYQVMGRKHGWRWTMGERQISGWLNRAGFIAMPDGGRSGRGGWSGKRCRYVDRAKVNRIAPPLADTEASR